MRRITWITTIGLCVLLILSGCGKKSAEGVVKDIEHVVNKLESYQASGSMLLHTGQQPLEYQVEVWFQNPHYYRIALTNVNQDITQIVLRNDEGVFVLTPHLNKSFRFQSDWPDHQGQVYLYQTLAHSVLKDQARQFTVDKDSDSYVFDVKANYQNSSLVRQKIWFNQKNYAPEHVEIYDEHSSVMVVVEFDQFHFDKSFEEDSFDMQRNMTTWNLQSTLPVWTEVDEEDVDSDERTDEESPLEEQETIQHFGVIEPFYVPEGVQKTEIKDIKIGTQQAVMIRYSGDYNYTIIETRPESRTVSTLPGTLVDLQFTTGVLTGDEHKILRWVYDDIEFRLTSGDLPQSEMVKIAQSVQGQIGK